jgi:very-short-patch-repair endonuclease
LFAALEADLRTAMQFELNGALPFDFGGRPAEVDLACRAVRLAVEVDGYHHFIDAEAYRRDRRKDRMLQLNGWLVFRVLADDLNDGADIDHVVDQIAETITRMKGDNQRT